MNQNQPKLGLIGYGSMGKALEEIAKRKGFEISAIYDIANPLTENDPMDFDVAVDFSSSNAVLDNIKILATKRKNLVIGTTGWYDQLDQVKQIAENSNIGVVWGSNFSIGMQFFFRIAQRAAMLMKRLDDFEVGLVEIHHKFKKDAPSGTSINLAKLFINELFRYDGFTADPNVAISDFKKIPIASLRLADVFGDHIVKIDTPYEAIELKHSAKNRNGFALGALEAAHWINRKQGFYSFNDVLTSYWS
jgi:4-hydroxy-tetrahydrodipicolinate reductase